MLQPLQLLLLRLVLCLLLLPLLLLRMLKCLLLVGMPAPVRTLHSAAVTDSASCRCGHAACAISSVGACGRRISLGTAVLLSISECDAVAMHCAAGRPSSDLQTVGCVKSTMYDCCAYNVTLAAVLLSSSTTLLVGPPSHGLQSGWRSPVCNSQNGLQQPNVHGRHSSSRLVGCIAAVG